jgi:hypothetical protein
LAATKRPRSKSRNRNIAIALGVSALIVLAAVYYEVPALINRNSSTSSVGASTLNYTTEYGNADNWAWSGGTAIPPANASVLALKGYQSFPFQASPFLAGGGSRQVSLAGISYVANVGNYELYAMNIETQNEIYDVVLPNYPLNALPYVLPFFHIATTSRIGGAPYVWVSTPWRGVYAFPASGATAAGYAFNATAPQKGQDGNVGTYSRAAPNFAIDEGRQLAVTGLSVNTTGVPGRGFVEGWSIGNQTTSLKFASTALTVKTATLAWTTYLSPPQDGSNPSWELGQVNSIPHVWEFNGTAALDLRTLSSSALQSILSNDWSAQSGHSVFSAGPESNSSWIADTATDTTYIATSAPQSVSLNDSFNGPGLFGSSIMALNTTTGSILWTFQVTPHDVWGWGCKGNIAMVPATIAGKQKDVIAKQCENGYLFILDPATGAMLYSGQTPGVVRASGAQIPSVQNQKEMHSSLASATGAGPTQHPLVAYGTNIAYDPDNGFLLGAVGRYSGQLGSETAAGSAWNSTAYAFDLAKMTFAWQAPVPNQDFSCIGISNGVAYMATYQGEIYIASTQTGSQLKDIHAAMAVTSLLVTNGVRGHPGLVTVGNGIQTKQQIQMELFTPSGL